MNKFMKLAIAQAKKGIKNNDGGPFGAVIVKEGKVIAKARNKVLKTRCAVNHAEINAIKKASEKLKNYDLKGCEIYTTCMPCPMCLAAIQWANIDTVYFGNTSDDAQKIGFRDKRLYEKQDIKLKNINRKKTLKLFKLWDKKEDKIIY